MKYIKYLNENRVSIQSSLNRLAKPYIEMGCEVDLVVRYYESIYLNLIRIPDNLKGQGIATRFMSDLIKWADDKKFVITLSPTDKMGSDLPRLTKFYEKFGFIKNRHNALDSKWVGAMIRFPN